MHAYKITIIVVSLIFLNIGKYDVHETHVLSDQQGDNT